MQWQRTLARILLFFAATCSVEARNHHLRGRHLLMPLVLSIENPRSVPVLMLPKEAIHDDPLVKDAGVAGNEQPPRVRLLPLNHSDLLEPPTGQYMAMCLVTSDTGAELREWIDHYLRLGVRKFYVFDHTNVSKLHAFSDLYQLGIVDYMPVPDKGRPWRQFVVYELCLHRYRMKHKWIAFIDSDEYLMLKDSSVASLPMLLKEYEEYGGLGINWRVFGSSGHLHHPPGSIIKNYKMCTQPSNPINEHVKTIVNTRFVESHANNPHAFMYQSGHFPVNENKKEIPNFDFTFGGAVTAGMRSAERIELHHYITKSIEQYKRKVMRGSINKTPYKTLQWFQDLDASCVDTCNSTELYMANRPMPSMEELQRSALMA